MKWTILLFSLMFSLGTMAQGESSKNDILVTKNGEFMQGQVVKVSGNMISFKYPGESVINEINPSELQKIVFSSGRVQNFSGNDSNQNSNSTPAQSANKQQQLKGSAASSFETDTIPKQSAEQSRNAVKPEEIFLLPEYDQNSLAVIPLSFTRNDNYDQDLSSESTNFINSFLKQNGVKNGIEVMGLKTTIDKLVSQNINHASLQSASLSDLQKAINARYVLSAEITERSADAPKEEPSVNSFYAPQQQTEKKSKATSDAATGKTFTITFKVYDANLKEIAYEAELEQNLKGAYIDKARSSDEWKAPLEYLLNQFLMEEPL